MAKFIVCDYHGTESKGFNPPVNIDCVQFIDISSSSPTIEFNFQGSDRVVWLFADSETRFTEYNRIMDIVTAEE